LHYSEAQISNAVAITYNKEELGGGGEMKEDRSQDEETINVKT
jgi:hypothetical protein